MSDFLKEIAELKAKVRMMETRLAEIEGPEAVPADNAGGISIMEELEIKMIAFARRNGDKGPLQARQRRYGLRVRNGKH